jgi:hypothetical protein
MHKQTKDTQKTTTGSKLEQQQPTQQNKSKTNQNHRTKKQINQSIRILATVNRISSM